MLSFDLETWLIAPGRLAPPLVCGSLCDEKTRPTASVMDKARTLEWARANLPTEHVVGANIAYDMAVLGVEDPSLVPVIFKAYAEGRIHDVSIREALLDIARGHHGVDPSTGRILDDDAGVRYPLSSLVLRYLGKDISASKHAPDAWRLRYAELDGIPLYDWPKAAIEYPADDARHTLEVYLAQEAAAKETINGGNLHDEARSVRNAWALHLISCWGLRTSAEAVAKLEAEVDEKHRLALIEFKAAGIIRPNGVENKAAVRARVSDAYHGDPPLTPKGSIATDRDTKLESADPVLIAHGNSGKNNKYRTTYLPKLKGGTDKPINPIFYGMAATTRVTSDYQQLPRRGGVRECHHARKGSVYCSVDYGGLELRTMSQRAIWTPEVGYSTMADALLAGQDVHCVAAAKMMGLTYEEVYARHKAKDKTVGGFRDLAKIFNFGKGGGMGANTLVYYARAKEGVHFCQVMKSLEKCGSAGWVGITVRGQDKRVCAECARISSELNAGWLEAWPEQAALFSLAKDLIHTHGKVTATIPGINVQRANCRYSQWLNTPFQGLGAAITTLAMWRITTEMFTIPTSPLYGSRLVLNVHDELIAELREDVFRDAAERMAFLMREAAAEMLPDLAKAIEAEPAVSRTMSKDAATVRNEKGELQIWEPKPCA